MKARITDRQRRCLEAAIEGDGLIFRQWAMPTGDGQSVTQAMHERWAPRLEPDRERHRTQEVEILIKTGWLITTARRAQRSYRVNQIARPTDHMRLLLAVSLFRAGLFTTRDELNAFTPRMKEEASVYADAQLSGRPFVAPHWIRIMLKSPWRVSKIRSREIAYESMMARRDARERNMAR